MGLAEPIEISDCCAEKADPDPDGSIVIIKLETYGGIQARIS
jgi:hypothetical protein